MTTFLWWISGLIRLEIAKQKTNPAIHVCVRPGLFNRVPMSYELNTCYWVSLPLPSWLDSDMYFQCKIIFMRVTINQRSWHRLFTTFTGHVWTILLNIAQTFEQTFESEFSWKDSQPQPRQIDMCGLSEGRVLLMTITNACNRVTDTLVWCAGITFTTVIFICFYCSMFRTAKWNVYNV